MPYSTTKANLLHLSSFVTRHPEVPAKVDSLLGASIDISGKLSSFVATYQKEFADQENATEAFAEGKMKLASLEKSLADDAEHFEKLFEVYGQRSGQVASFPQFVKKGGFEANLREFLAALTPYEAAIQIWDVQNILPKLRTDFAEYESYAATQSEKQLTAAKESTDVATALDSIEGFVLLARDLLRRTCSLYFPNLLAELILYHRVGTKPVASSTPTVTVGPLHTPTAGESTAQLLLDLTFSESVTIHGFTATTDDGASIPLSFVAASDNIYHVNGDFSAILSGSVTDWSLHYAGGTVGAAGTALDLTTGVVATGAVN